MKPPDRWPLHPAPIDGEALSSWLHRIAVSYQMRVGELIEHGLDHDPPAERELDLKPPAALLRALGQRTGIGPVRLQEMTLGGWTPWLLDSLQAHHDAFDTYVRQFSILLKAGKRPRRAVGPWRAWIPCDPIQRACPRCADEPDRAGLLLIWALPLSLSCPDHGCLLKPCLGFPGDFVIWTDDDDPPRAASEAVLAMDRRTQQAFRTGQVRLPGRRVHAGVWFRLLRSILDEVTTPRTYWASHAEDLHRIWDSCAHPVRAGKATWRPFEAFPWPIQTQLLQAAAASMQLLENGTLTGRGTHANLFFPAPTSPVGDGRPTAPPKVDRYTQRWDLVNASLEHVIQSARVDPSDAQALYERLVTGCRTPQAVERVLADLEELGILTTHLSHNQDPRTLRVT